MRGIVKDPKDIPSESNSGSEIDGISRRRFLTLLSASATLALGASCSKVDRGTIVPYTKRPGEIIPGVADYYASTFQEGLTTHGVLIKTREGRPIHIEGSAEQPILHGKPSLRAMGDLLGLYDPDRLRAPSHNGTPSTWEEAQKAMIRALSDARSDGKSVLFLTGAIISPTQKALINDLKLAVPNLYHASWEPGVSHAEALASAALFGKAVIPRLHFDRANVIVSLQSDFLGADEKAPVFIRDFSAPRAITQPGESMNRLWVIEGGMTLTGANADKRLQVRPSKMAALAFALARILNEDHSLPLPPDLKPEDLKPFALEPMAKSFGVEPSMLLQLAADLGRAQESALVVAGPMLPPEAHLACHMLNFMLGSEGATADLEPGIPYADLRTLAELQELFKAAAEGEFAAAIFWDSNPAYAFPDSSVWKSAIAKIPETFRIGLYEDETALDCAWRLPEHHWLEAWGDFQSAPDFISLRQPVIGAIHSTRQAEELLLSCVREMQTQAAGSYLEYLKSRWRLNVYPQESPAPFETFWNAALHDGGVKQEPGKQAPLMMNAQAIKDALAAPAGSDPAETREELELILSPGTGVYDGRYANNGWLNELPDPVTKATWGNPLLLSQEDAQDRGLKDGDLAEISTGGQKVEASVMIQPGQTAGVATLTLGYGRRTGNVAAGIGTNAYPLLDISSNAPFLIPGVRIVRKQNGERREIPRRQTHARTEGYEQVRSWTLAEFSAKAGDTASRREKHGLTSMIPDLKFPDHKWSMAIDLSACVGCSACVIACQSENNIPVVGPEQIRNGRDMHWIRIDRYYDGDSRDPSVLHQPMLCQHCDNAPCEIVCPVNATTHSPDGLNQMVYNRCVGTRYCSNNCPFKVRRFNFFDYTSMKKEPENLVYNPEVTVRPRGVMEKCTFCIQRIDNAKQKARIEGRKIMDGEIQPACAAACPANAIVFGDLNDVRSRVAVLSKLDRSYRMLEELGIKPSITYLVDISNPPNGAPDGALPGERKA
jgi:Fe-S-cluster-containing dehydrogenase component/anaerobic selenocysteine-containing dehydrogenase